MAQESWWVWPGVRDQDRPRRALGPPCYLLIVNPSHSGQCFSRDPWKHLEKSLYLYLFVCVGGGDSICADVCNEHVEATDGQWVPSSYTCTPYMLRQSLSLTMKYTRLHTPPLTTANHHHHHHYHRCRHHQNNRHMQPCHHHDCRHCHSQSDRRMKPCLAFLRVLGSQLRSSCLCGKNSIH